MGQLTAGPPGLGVPQGCSAPLEPEHNTVFLWPGNQCVQTLSGGDPLPPPAGKSRICIDLVRRPRPKYTSLNVKQVQAKDDGDMVCPSEAAPAATQGPGRPPPALNQSPRQERTDRAPRGALLIRFGQWAGAAPVREGRVSAPGGPGDEGQQGHGQQPWPTSISTSPQPSTFRSERSPARAEQGSREECGRILWEWGGRVPMSPTPTAYRLAIP